MSDSAHPVSDHDAIAQALIRSMNGFMFWETVQVALLAFSWLLSTTALVLGLTR